MFNLSLYTFSTDLWASRVNSCGATQSNQAATITTVGISDVIGVFYIYIAGILFSLLLNSFNRIKQLLGIRETDLYQVFINRHRKKQSAIPDIVECMEEKESMDNRVPAKSEQHISKSNYVGDFLQINLEKGCFGNNDENIFGVKHSDRFIMDSKVDDTEKNCSGWIIR